MTILENIVSRIKTINRLPVIKNLGRYSFVIDLFSWALPFNYDSYPGPGGYGWTHRFRVLCFNFHYRTKTSLTYEPEYEPYDWEEDDIPF